MGSALLAAVRKDLTDTGRHPLTLALSVFVPLVFVGIFALVIQTSATNPIAVADHAQSEASQEFIRVLESIGNADGDYFNVTTTRPAAAAEAYERRQVAGVIHIPADFDDQVAAGGSAPITLDVFNIDSDLTKNIELRLSHAVLTYGAPVGDSRSPAVTETSHFPRDMPMQRYLGTALLMFAVIFLAMMNTGSLVAAEWEQHTAKGVVLSPLGFAPLIIGKWLAAGLLSLVALAVVLATLGLGLGYPVGSLSLVSWGYLAVLFAYGAALGALLGVKLKNALLLVPAAAVISVAHLLLAGFESYIRGFAHDGVLQGLWWVGSWWPVSAITDQVRFDVESFAQAGIEPVPLLLMLAITAVLSAAAIRHLRHQLTFAQGM